MSNIDIHIITPGSDNTYVSQDLRKLTKEYCKLYPDERCYGLGGEDGYGFNLENDVFVIHRFCWCENDDCPWCNHEPEALAFRPNLPRMPDPYGDKCGEHRNFVPNFWHKKSGWMIRWYKWIGRDNKIVQGSMSFADVIGECLASINRGK